MRKIEKRLRERIKELESKLTLVEEERNKHRNFWEHKVKWFLKIHSENKTPDMAWLIMDLMKHYQNCGKWYW